MINTGVAIGRFVFEHELKDVGDTVVLKNRIAVDRAGGRDPESGELIAGFFDVEAWGKTAELLDQYTSKGSQIGIQYSLKHDTWVKEDEDGEEIKQSKVILRISEIQFLGGNNSDDDEDEKPQRSKSKSASKGKPSSKSRSSKSEDGDRESAREPVGAGKGKSKSKGYNPFE
jgi:single-strand DNA-binding protein